MTNPVSLRRANSSRNAASRAVSATPPSGSSNVWKRASNIAGDPRIACRSPQCEANCLILAWIMLELLHLRQRDGTFCRHLQFYKGGNSRSVSTQRRGNTQCLLLRLRKYHRRPAAARLLQSSKTNAVSSSRSWIVSSRRASSGRCARKKASSPVAGRNRRIRPHTHNRSRSERLVNVRSGQRSCSAFQVGCLHHGDVHDLRPLDLSHNPLIRAYNAKIKLPIVRDQYHSFACDHDHRYISGPSGHGPFLDLAAKRLFAPGVGKTRVASDFNSVLRCCQNKFGPARLPVLVQPFINQPKAAVGLTLGRPGSIHEPAAPRFAMPAPG